MINQVYLGDCLEIMPKEIENESVDMILCDLPYGVLNKSNPSAKWDSQIPFDQLWKEYNRVIKPNGAIVLFGSGMFTAKLMLSNEKMWRYNLIWYKDRSTGFLNANRMPLRKHEDICVFYKKLPTYNPQFESCTPDKRNHSKGNPKEIKKNQCYGNYNVCRDLIVDYKYPTSVIQISKEHDKFYHPTQKPVALCEYLIKTYSNEGDIILDNACGSGSTLIAAKNTNRQYIGIEKEEKYYNITKERLNY